MKPSPADNIDPSAKSLVRHHASKNLTAPLGSGAEDYWKAPLIFQEIGESHWHDRLLHMRLRSTGQSTSCLGLPKFSSKFKGRISKNNLSQKFDDNLKMYITLCFL